MHLTQVFLVFWRGTEIMALEKSDFRCKIGKKLLEYSNYVTTVQ